MNDASCEENRRTSDMTTADHVAIAVILFAIVLSGIAGALDGWKLMWVAALISLPAGVVKVRLTRARSRAAYHESQPAGRERRVPRQSRPAATAGLAS